MFHNYTSSGNLNTIDSFVLIGGNTYPSTYYDSGGSTGGTVISGRLGEFSHLKPRFGTGTTPPVATDYCLENDITNSFSNITVSKTYNLVGDEYNIEATINISAKNNTGSSIEVSEIGLCFDGNVWVNGNNTASTPLLIYREVLSSPVTIGDNETLTMTIKWTEG